MERKELYVLLLIAVAALFGGSLWFSVEHGPEINSSRSRVVSTDGAWGSIRPLARPPVDLLKAELGRQLFTDTRLSADATLSCESCHDPKHGGADGRKVSIGVGGAKGGINAPTVFNAAFNLAQFWDGRAPTLEAQVAGPIHNPKEMASDWATVVARLKSDPKMNAAFGSLYPDGLTAENIADAIACFERTLITLNSKFDRYLSGDALALSALELEGYRKFLAFGCVSCHQGALLGGNMYQRFGVVKDYYAGRESAVADRGRYNVTGRDSDLHVFKVPGLRNVSETAPYFHDASAETLERAVLVMGQYQLGKTLSRHDVRAIVAFLNTLTGELPK